MKTLPGRGTCLLRSRSRSCHPRYPSVWHVPQLGLDGAGSGAVLFFGNAAPLGEKDLPSLSWSPRSFRQIGEAAPHTLNLIPAFGTLQEAYMHPEGPRTHGKQSACELSSCAPQPGRDPMHTGLQGKLSLGYLGKATCPTPQCQISGAHPVCLPAVCAEASLQGNSQVKRGQQCRSSLLKQVSLGACARPIL